jgi:GNAT superfamily N-acetyltransferase
VITPTDAPEWLDVFTAEERPDIWEKLRAEHTFDEVWPEYNNHGNHTSSYFSALYPRFPHLQSVFVDRRTGRFIARGRTIPFHWDGTLDDLPPGIDAVGKRALDDPSEPNALSALAAEVAPDFQGSGLSRLVIQSMASMAGAAGLSPLVAPVRPSWKDRYPLTSIERYASWRRDDGLLFDPWLRVHERLGARVLRTEPRSLEIVAPVEEWTQWTRLSYPEDGDYVFPNGLAPLTVTGDIGEYWEPNVWMLHEV